VTNVSRITFLKAGDRCSKLLAEFGFPTSRAEGRRERRLLPLELSV
jgi:hypothetical protein